MYRLREYFRYGPPYDWPTVYRDVDAAVDAAELAIRGIERIRPSRAPWQVLVLDPATGEVVTRVTATSERNRDLCTACGQPLDPFAVQTVIGHDPTNPAAVSRGDTPPGAEDPFAEPSTPGGPA